MEKNEIIIKTNNLEQEKKFYFLYNKENNEDENEYLKELNDGTVEIYIDDSKIKFEKYFIPTESKSYTIKLKFKKNNRL